MQNDKSLKTKQGRKTIDDRIGTSRLLAISAITSLFWTELFSFISAVSFIVGIYRLIRYREIRSRKEKLLIALYIVVWHIFWILKTNPQLY